MDGRNVRLLAVSVAGTVAIFAVLFFLVGGRRVLEVLFTATPSLVAVTFVFGLGWLAAWSLMLWVILGTLEVDVPVGKSFFIYAAVVFANNVTPFGQAGGEPIAALLISRASRARYETGLVGIASLDVLNVVPSVSLVLVGVGYYAAHFTLGDRLQTAVGSAIVLVVTVTAVLVLTWRYRHEFVDRTAGVISRIAGRFRLARFATGEVTEQTITDRMHRFFGHVERVAVNRRRLVSTLGLSLLGWLFQGAALLAAFAAVGYTIPLYVVLFVIPLGNLAGVAPLPGGLGGIEAAFVALLVPTTGVPASVVTAAVLIFRAAIYWMPVFIGGGSMTALGVRTLA